MLALQKIHLATLGKAANANLFRDDICLEYVVSKQKFLSPSPGPQEMWPKENMNRVFHFVSHQNLLRGKGRGNHGHSTQRILQADVLVKEMHTFPP